MPYLSSALLIPVMPDAISFQTSSNSRFFTDARSAPISVKTCETLVDASAVAPIDDAICA